MAEKPKDHERTAYHDEPAAPDPAEFPVHSPTLPLSPSGPPSSDPNAVSVAMPQAPNPSVEPVPDPADMPTEDELAKAERDAAHPKAPRAHHDPKPKDEPKPDSWKPVADEPTQD